VPPLIKQVSPGSNRKAALEMVWYGFSKVPEFESLPSGATYKFCEKAIKGSIANRRKNDRIMVFYGSI